MRALIYFLAEVRAKGRIISRLLHKAIITSENGSALIIPSLISVEAVIGEITPRRTIEGYDSLDVERPVEGL